VIHPSNDNCSGVEPIYATREQAWAFVAGGSRKIFEEHYKPHVREHRRGGRIFYKYEELRKCADDMEAGDFTQIDEPETGSSGSRTKASGPTSRRARQIAQQLKSKPRESTPRLYPVGGNSAGEVGG